MSKFDNFMSKLGVVCKKAADKTVEVTDITATKVKIKAEQARLCERYEALGRECEALMREKDELPEQIAKCLDGIDSVKANIKKLEEELEEKKAKYSAEKTKDEEPAAEAEAEE